MLTEQIPRITQASCGRTNTLRTMQWWAKSNRHSIQSLFESQRIFDSSFRDSIQVPCDLILIRFKF